MRGPGAAAPWKNNNGSGFSNAQNQGWGSVAGCRPAGATPNEPRLVLRTAVPTRGHPREAHMRQPKIFKEVSKKP